MKAFFVMLAFVVVLTAALYYLYRSVFCYPLKKRSDVHDIPESRLYKVHRNNMLEVVNEMESTPFEEVSIRSTDGYRLYGKLYHIKENAPLMLFFHGYHGTYAWDGYGVFQICKNNGINILMVDERAHGKSEGKATTFGIRERYDCKLWTEYAADRFGEKTDLILAGVSMGAATVMMASKLELPETVRAIVADCGFSEPAAIIKETIRKKKLPVKPLYLLVNLAAYIFGGFNLREATALSAVKTLNIPILLIHGKEDAVVPLSMCEELYENCAGIKEKLIVDGAAHANSAVVDYEAYEKAVMDFLNMGS